MKGWWRALVLVAICGATTLVFARPVRVGSYTEIARGVRAEHPCSTMRCDSHRTGQAKAIAVHASHSVWRTPLTRGNDRGSSHLLSFEDGVLVAGDSHGLAFLNSDGAIIHRADVGAPRETPALSPSDELVFATDGGDVVLVDLHGRVRARRHEASVLYSPALMLQDGTVVFANAQRTVVGLSTGDLSDAFRTSVPALLRLLPVELGDDKLALISGSSGVVLGANGLFVSTFTARSIFRGPVAVSDDGVLWGVADDGAVVYADPRERSAGSAGATVHVANPPLIAADRSLRLLGVHEVVATDSRGNALWTYSDAARRVVNAVVDAEGNTIVLLDTALHSGRVVGVSPEGIEEWGVDFTDRPLEYPPAIASDGLVAVLALDAREGSTPVVLAFR